MQSLCKVYEIFNKNNLTQIKSTHFDPNLEVKIFSKPSWRKSNIEIFENFRERNKTNQSCLLNKSK